MTSAHIVLAKAGQPVHAALSQFISFGFGTVGFIKSEAEYQENIDKLKDVPECVLLRISIK
jgi:hypothetical protein